MSLSTKLSRTFEAKQKKWFLRLGYELSFRKKKFCLVTGFRFGLYFPASHSDAAFRSCVFPRIPRNFNVKPDDVRNVFEHSLNDLSKEDVVRICFLYMLEKGLNGL